MAGQAVANPTVILGLDDAPLNKGMNQAVANAASFGKKISAATMSSMNDLGKKISSALSSSFQSLGSVVSGALTAPFKAAKVLAPFNQVLDLVGKAQGMLSKPMSALMSREQEQADASGKPILNSSSTTMTGVFARLSQEIEGLAADAMVGLDKAFDFRAILEGFRGVVSGVRGMLAAAFGPLIAVADNPKSLEDAFKIGKQLAAEGFLQVANAVVDVADKIVTVVNAITSVFNLLKSWSPYTKAQEDSIAEWIKKNGQKTGFMLPFGPLGWLNNQAINKKNRNAAAKALGLEADAPLIPELDVPGLKKKIRDIVEGVKNGGRNGPADDVKAQMTVKEFTDFAKGLGEVKNPLQQMLDNMKKADAMSNAALAAAGKNNLDQSFIDQINKADIQRKQFIGAELQGLLAGTVQSMKDSRITSAAEVGSSALVEAIVRASAESQGGDIQQQIKAAIDLQLQEQKQQTKIQQKIYEAAQNGGALIGVGKI